MRKYKRWLAALLLLCVIGTAAVLVRENLNEEGIQPNSQSELFKREGLPIRFRIPPELIDAYSNERKEAWNRTSFGNFVTLRMPSSERYNSWKEKTSCTIQLNAVRERDAPLAKRLQDERLSDPDAIEKHIKVGSVPSILREINLKKYVGEDFLYIQVFTVHETLRYTVTLESKGGDSLRKRCRKSLQNILDTISFEE